MDTTVYCSISQQSGATDTHSLKVFLAPELYIGEKIKSSFIFEETMVPGGLYHLVCILSDHRGIIWANIKSIVYKGTQVAFLSLKPSLSRSYPS